MSVYGVGYIGEGKYKSNIKGTTKMTKAYTTWKSMLGRCYYLDNSRGKYLEECTVCEEWHNFQNFAEWFYQNIYECDEQIQLDKDVLVRHNKQYAPDRCLLLPASINMLFREQKPNNSGLPRGIRKQPEGFMSILNNKSLGVYKTIEEAVMVWCKKKDEHNREVIKTYKDILPPKVFEHLMAYETDYQFVLHNVKNVDEIENKNVYSVGNGKKCKIYC